MEFHTVAGSPNSHKVEAVIDHLGLKVTIVHHDFPAGLKTSAYLALNPNGKAPTLVDGDFVLWESNAIMQYLADKAGDEALLPRDPRVRADVTRWQFWELVHFNAAFGTLAFETVAKPHLGLEPDVGIVASGIDDLARYAPVLEKHLASRNRMVGDTITLADYSVATFESYRGKVPFDWAPYPNINRYFDSMKQVGSWSRTAVKQVSAPATAKAA